MRIAATLALLATIMLAGCSGPSNSDAYKAESDAALQQFVTDMDLDGTIQGFNGSFKGLTPEQSGSFALEFGAGKSFRMVMNSPQLNVTMICAEGRMVIQYTNQTLASRSADATCIPQSQAGAASFLPHLAPLETSEFVKATSTKGRIKATYNMINPVMGGATPFSITIEDGHVTQWALDLGTGGQSGGFQLDVLYGERQNFTLPDNLTRVPADDPGQGQFEPGQFTWTGFNRGPAKVADFEVRIYAGPISELCDATPGNDNPRNLDNHTPVASFQLTPGNQSDGGFNFQFNSNGDELLGPGDNFTVTREDWQEASDYTVMLWDKWADDSSHRQCRTIPGAGPLVLLASVIGSLAILRRRLRA